MSRVSAPAARLTVVHFGNRPDGEGGIAAVIRQHLRVTDPPTQVTAVTTFDQDAGSMLGRQRPMLAALLAATRLSGRATVAHLHLSRRGSLAREGAVLLVLRLRRVPVVVTLHGSTLDRSTGPTLLALRALVRLADRVHGFDDVYRARFRVPSGRWIVIPNSVDVGPVGGGAGGGGRRRGVLFAGVVGRRKGADVLLDAWRDMPGGVELHVYGVLDRGFTMRAGSGVVAHGPVPHEEVLAAMRAVDIVVQPSRAEAFPMTVCEALAAGCAVIGTDVGGMGGLLRRAGQTVVPLDAQALRASLVDLLLDPRRRAEQGARARMFAEVELASPAVAARWSAVYSALARGNPA